MDVNARLELAFPIARPMRSPHIITQCHPTAHWDRDAEMTLFNGKPK